MNNSRGSEWHKWDLHIHSPESINQQYKNTQEGWEKFISALENLPDEIKVIGINDYYFIEGYEKVMKYKKEGRLNNLNKIFPILEFRIDTFSTASESAFQKVNLHILFNLDEKIIEQEIKKVKEEFIEQIPVTKLPEHSGKRLSKENLCALEGTIEKGFANLIPPADKVLELLDKPEWRGRTFILLGYKEWNNLEKGKNQLKIHKEYLFKKANAFFGNNFETNEKNQKWLNQYGSKKLLHSLDIHDFKNLDTFEFDETGQKREIRQYHCNTWIKAEHSFEGLKQIIFEPQLRCKITSENPDNKLPHKCIKSVSFIGHSYFCNEEIYFSNDLNTIIGGKSSGKSLLLYYIAQTIDYKYANKQHNPSSEIDNTLKDKYKFSEEEHFDFKITWNDDVTYRFSERLTIKDRSFVYIPQSYILNLTDNIERKSRKVLGKFIRDILKQQKNSNQAYSAFEKKVKLLDIIRDNLIDDFYKLESDISNLNMEKKNIGDKSGLINYIKSQDELLNTLKLKSKFSQKELDRYNTLKNRRERLEHYKINILEEFDRLIVLYKSKIIDNDNFIIKDFNSKPTRLIFEQFNKFHNKLNSHINKEIENINEQVININHKLQFLLEIINHEIEPLSERLQDKGKIKTLEETIRDEKNKLARVNKIEEEINTINTQSKPNIKEKLITAYKDAYFEYLNIIGVLNESGAYIEDLELIGSVKFYHNRFRENLKSHFNMGSKKGKELLEKDICKDYKNNLPEIIFSNHIAEIMTIFDDITNDNLSLNKYKTKKDATKALFKDEFFDYWELKVGNDEMANMSPGKANLMILKLLIDLSESNSPILIDQPEDNLDNRSIYNDLVQFLRKRKVNRQIIIVSHNPNIVVASDSENVIVANQNDQDEERKNANYRFEYINGALENSFKLEESDIDKIGILKSMGIREHVTDILEGGKEAFIKREEKYGF